MQQFTVEDGLTQSNVNDLHQDKDGFIWIATDEGLNRFDGYTFKQIKHNNDDSTSISGNRILDIFEDSEGRIWFGTDQYGLNLMDRKNSQFKHYSHDINNDQSISENSVTKIMEDKNHKLWIGTYWGLNVFDTETEIFRSFYEDSNNNELGGNSIYDLLEVGNEIYIAHNKGISILNQNDFTFKNFFYDFNDNETITPGEVKVIFSDSQKRIWVGTDMGLNLFNPDTEKFTRFTNDPSKPSSISSNIINSIYEDWNGNIWFATDGGGISILDGTGKFIRLKANNIQGFDRSSVYSILEDDERIWIGTFGEGIYLHKKRGEKFIHFKDYHDEIIQSGKNSVLDFLEDKQGNIWVGTDGSGLYQLDANNNVIDAFLHNARDSRSISSNVIKSLLLDKQGNIYAGTYAGGLNYIDTQTKNIIHFSTLPTEGSMTNNHVWALHESSDGKIWIGTLSGINVLDPQTKKIKSYKYDYDDANAYSSEATFRIITDSRNNLWFATPNGLNKYIPESDSFKRFSKENSNIPSEYVKDVFESRDRSLWIITDVGLAKFNYKNESFTVVELDRLISTNIQSVLEDENGYFWISSYNGIVKLDLKSKNYRQFDVGDGIQGKEFNYDANLKSSTGNYYFGGLNGFNIFKPGNIIENQTGPNVILSGFMLFHRPVFPRDETRILNGDINYIDRINLDYSQNVFSIAYAALDYEFPKGNKYAYQLEGFDKEWNFVDNDRIATYTNLSPGEYIFNVKASNKDGFWSPTPKSISITISTPYWYTTWFRIMLVVIAISILLLLVKFRIQRIVRKKKELEKHVLERTSALRDEVETRIIAEKKLMDMVQQLQKAKDKLIVHEKMASLGVLTAGISHEMNNPLNFIAGGINIIENEINNNNIPKKNKEILISALEMVQNGFERSITIVKSLTSLSNKDHPILINANISELLDNVTELLQSKLVGIELKRSYNLNPIPVYPDRLQQAVLNIMENAIFATLSDANINMPEIRIETQFVKKEIPEGKIVITNTGEEIENSIISKLFDPFFTTKDPGIGTGLGLSTAYSFVTQHGGTIEAQNISEGVSFIITLPIKRLSKKVI